MNFYLGYSRLDWASIDVLLLIRNPNIDVYLV